MSGMTEIPGEEVAKAARLLEEDPALARTFEAYAESIDFYEAREAQRKKKP